MKISYTVINLLADGYIPGEDVFGTVIHILPSTYWSYKSERYACLRSLDIQVKERHLDRNPQADMLLLNEENKKYSFLLRNVPLTIAISFIAYAMC